MKSEQAIEDSFIAWYYHYKFKVIAIYALDFKYFFHIITPDLLICQLIAHLPQFNFLWYEVFCQVSVPCDLMDDLEMYCSFLGNVQTI